MKTKNIFEEYKSKGETEFCEIKKVKEDDMVGYNAEIVSANILNAKACTNGYHGGDAGHGGHSYIELQNSSCSCMQITVSDEDGVVFQTEEGVAGQSVRIDMRGDTELYTLIESLRFMADALEDASDYGNTKYGVKAYVITVDKGNATIEAVLPLENAFEDCFIPDEVVLMAKNDARHRVTVVSKSKEGAKEKALSLVEQYIYKEEHSNPKLLHLEWNPLISQKQLSTLPWFEFQCVTQKCRDELEAAYPMEFHKVVREYKEHILAEKMKSQPARKMVDVFMAIDQHF